MHRFHPWPLALVLLGVLLGGGPAAAEEGGERGYYRQPTVHANTIVFVAEGDLWSVSWSGGAARRLTTHPDMELHPAISPDGKRIAFSGRYEGPTEVYVMPIEGGRPTRLTYGAGRPRVVGWTPDGRVLYSTRRYSTLPDRQLVALDPDTGVHERIPLAQADEGVYAPDGSLVFTRLPFQGSHAKRYQGGSVQQLWRWSGKAGEEAVPLTADHPGTSKNPMVFDGPEGCRIYFLSDRDGTMNVWSMALDDPKDLRQHTKHRFFDVREASLAGSHLVYRIGADLHVMDLLSDQVQTPDIRLVTDADQTRRKWITDPMDFVTHAAPSPSGDRAVLTSRGRVFVAPAEPGRLVELPPQGTARQRTAVFSHDGASILYFSDHTDEVELWSRPADGSSSPKQLTKEGKSLRNDLRPSPDGRWAAHTDLASGLYVTDLAAAETRVVVEPGVHHGVRVETWSRDGRWLVYALERAEDLDHPILVLFDTQDGTSTELTSHDYASHDAVFGPKGEWLYFLSERTFDSIARSPWGARQPEPHFDRQTRIYALALKPGLRPPFQEPDELSRAAEEAKKKAEQEKKKAKADDPEKPKEDAPKEDDDGKGTDDVGDEAKVEPLEIVTEGIAARLEVLPVPAGRYDGLVATKSHLLWRASPGPFVEGKGGSRRFDLQALKLGEEKAEVKTRLEDVGEIALTKDGKQLMVRQGKGLAFVPADANAPIDPKILKKGRVRLDGWRFAVDPRREWRQMYDDAWRMHRDYFYDPGMHGVDWARMREVYRPLVDRVRDRDELQDLTGMLISELSALHASVRGGDLREGSDKVEVGSLGARFVKDPPAGGYRLEHVFASDPDRPELGSPLARPDLDVAVGDVLVAVDHRPVLPSRELGEHLVDRAGKQVLLTFRRKDREKDAEMIVKPLSARDAWNLRYHEWQYTRRLEAEQLGDGRIGYLHLRGMGANDMADFVRQYYPVYQREGLIIDVRHNWGGNIDAWLLSRLMREAWMYWQARTGEPYSNLRFAPRGHMIVLCDQKTASDGEAFSEGFRRLGLGPVMGMRTWGGEIWLHSGNRLADKGVASAGMFGVFGPAEDGSGMIWLVEGHGVEPDIVVDNPPHATFQGIDSQLRTAIAWLRAKIEREPVPKPKRPPYPDKSHPNNR